MNDLFAEEVVSDVMTVFFRICLAMLLGALIGYEREQTNRPAGLRTHALVCVGAALAMLTGAYVSRHVAFGGSDPSRLGAQVISGIGFLGAGTIMRAGFNVRGLTTAASLWAVSCVGLACGVGYYAAAIGGGGAICLILVLFKRIDKNKWIHNTFRAIVIRTREAAPAMTEVGSVLRTLGVEVRNTEFIAPKTHGGPMTIRLSIRMPNCSIPELYEDIRTLPNVEEVSIE